MNIKRPDLYRTEQFNKWFNNLRKLFKSPL